MSPLLAIETSLLVIETEKLLTLGFNANQIFPIFKKIFCVILLLFNSFRLHICVQKITDLFKCKSFYLTLSAFLYDAAQPTFLIQFLFEIH